MATVRSREATEGEASRRSARRFFLVLAVVTGAAAVALYGPTLRMSFAYDDIDYLNAAADHLSGRVPLATILFRPQGEHFLPALRLLIAANAQLFGPDAFPLRLLVLLSHVASALFLAGVASRYLPGRTAPATAALAYVLPAGFSSMWIWFPSGGCVPLGIAAITGAMLAVARQGVLGRRRALAVASVGVAIAVLFENALLPLAACPALLDEWETRHEGTRKGFLPGTFSVSLLVAVGAAAAATSWAYGRLTGASIHLDLGRAATRAAFLLVVAPFRLVFPAQHLPRLLGDPAGSPGLAGAFGLVVWLGGAALVTAVLAPRARPLSLAALASAAGPLGFVALVALGRSSNSSEEMFDADRYFFPLLIPLSLLTAAFVASAIDAARNLPGGRRRALAVLALATVAAEVPIHAVAVRRRAPAEVYARHERRFGQLARLGALLGEAAERLPTGAPPIEVPDGNLFFSDVHNGRLSTRFLLFVATRPRSPRVRLGGPTVGGRDEALVNGVLERWEREIGEPAPTFRVVGGVLRDVRHGGAVRFGLGPEDWAVVGGLYGWEGVCRWMGSHATLGLVASSDRLRLRLAVPVSALRRWRPGLPGVDVSVSLADRAAGGREEIGRLRIVSDGVTDYVLPIPPPLASRLANREVLVYLDGSPTWKPRDVLPGATDDRELTVQLYEVAFVE